VKKIICLLLQLRNKPPRLHAVAQDHLHHAESLLLLKKCHAKASRRRFERVEVARLYLVARVIPMKKANSMLFFFCAYDNLANIRRSSSDHESIAMSQSDSDLAPSDDGHDAKPYKFEKIYHDAADKARIAALPLVEREAAISARYEEVDRWEQNQLIHKMLLKRNKDSQKLEKKAKRKADDAGLDENQRKSSRQRTKVGGESRGAIDRYKQQRAEKNLRDETRRQTRARSNSPMDDYSDDDAQGESDFEDRKPVRKRSPSPIKDDPPAELADINRARIGRENFAQVCQTPGFDQAIVGCYARINIGPGKDPRVNVYRVAVIKSVEKGRPYAMMATNVVFMASFMGTILCSFSCSSSTSSSLPSRRASLICSASSSFSRDLVTIAIRSS
jgi:hypothetical protein